MSERRQFIPEKVFPLGVIEHGNEIVQRDLKLVYSGKIYILSVGTQDYLDALKKYNQRFSEEEQLDENVLVMENVHKLEDVISNLSTLESQEIIPYLTEQKEDQT